MSKSKAMMMALACAALAGYGEISIDDQKALDAMNNRTMVLSRQKIEIGGEYYFVEHWQNPKDGKEWVTNKCFKVIGKKQTTSWGRIKKQLEDDLAEAEVDAEKARKVEKNAAKAKKKDEKNFNKWISDTEKAKSKSSTDMAEFYDSILELAKTYDGGSN